MGSLVGASMESSVRNEADNGDVRCKLAAAAKFQLNNNNNGQ